MTRLVDLQMFLLFQWGDFSGSMLVFGGLHLQLQSMIIFKTLDCSLIHCQCQQVSVIILTPTPTLTKKEYYIEHELVFSVSFFASLFLQKCDPIIDIPLIDITKVSSCFIHQIHPKNLHFFLQKIRKFFDSPPPTKSTRSGGETKQTKTSVKVPEV